MGNTRKLIEAVREGRVHYDFVEVMACPGGCTGGGGQPIQDGQELVYQRGKVLYELDERANLRFSHENQAVQTLYKEYLGRPLSELSETLLHTELGGWPMPGHPHQRKE